MFLLRFANLVHTEVLENMSPCDLFILSSLSKKSTDMCKSARNQQKFHLEFGMEGSFEVSKNRNNPNFNHENDAMKVKIENAMQQRPGPECQFISILNQKVLVQRGKQNAFGTPVTLFIEKTIDTMVEMLRLFIELYPKLEITLDIGSAGIDDFGRIITLIRELKKDVTSITVGSFGFTEDKVVTAAIENFKKAKRFIIAGGVSSEFSINLNTTDPFHFDFIKVSYAAWITKDYFLHLLLDCKAVILNGIQFEVEELEEIIMKWSQGHSMTYLELYGEDEHYQHMSISQLVEMMPNTAAVNSARVYNNQREVFELITFPRERCFSFLKADGTQALVYEIDKFFFLTTKFTME